MVHSTHPRVTQCCPVYSSKAQSYIWIVSAIWVDLWLPSFDSLLCTTHTYRWDLLHPKSPSSKGRSWKQSASPWALLVGCVAGPGLAAVKPKLLWKWQFNLVSCTYRGRHWVEEFESVFRQAQRIIRINYQGKHSLEVHPLLIKSMDLWLKLS